MKRLTQLTMACVAVLVATSGQVQAGVILHLSRSSFESSVSNAVTDDYSTAYPGLGVFTNAQMDSFFGETNYVPLTFPNQNQITKYRFATSPGYCSGCNGNFRLEFGGTSLTSNAGVFGVGLDIVLHTSRRSAIGDALPGQSSVEGVIRFDFVDGDFIDVSIPADIGFFGPQSHFIGVTHSESIKTLTIGTEPTYIRHSWIIDNLSIGGHYPQSPSQPHSPSSASVRYACLALAVFASVSSNSRKQASVKTNSVQ